jgi:hypothetical protein
VADAPPFSRQKRENRPADLCNCNRLRIISGCGRIAKECESDLSVEW